MNLLGLANCENRRFLVLVTLFELALWGTIVLDVPIVRQVLGFLILTFLPGFVLTKLFRLNNLDRLEVLLFSVGLSISFLMFSSLAINYFLPLLGITNPLSVFYLYLIQSVFVIVGAIVLCLTSGNNNLLPSKLHLSINPLEIILICLPIVSIIGAIYSNTVLGHLTLLTLIIVIAVLFFILAIKQKLSPKVYPLALFTIALALVFHASTVSQYIISFGSDVPAEYLVFKTVQDNSMWFSSFPLGADSGYGRLNAMLSITVLPVTYSNILNVSPETIFKIIFPILFALVPLCIFKLWSPILGAKNAFIASFFFISLDTFYGEALGLNRQIIAELFFALILIILLTKKINLTTFIPCLIIFSAGLITSHYGLAEILIFFVLVVTVWMLIKKSYQFNNYLMFLVLFSVLMFLWYLFSSNSSVFNSFLSFGDNVLKQLNDFLNPESRGDQVLTGLGLTVPPTFWNWVGRFFAYLTEIFILLGFFAMLLKKTCHKIERTQLVFSSTAIGLLAMLVLVPGLANTLGMARFYHILLFFLAGLFILGTEFVSKLLSKKKHVHNLSVIIALIILIPYFLFQTGLIYDVTNSQSYSVPLSRNDMSSVFLRQKFGFFNTEEIFGAKWLNSYADCGNLVYSDSPSAYCVLIDYGQIYNLYLRIFSNVTSFSEKSNSYVYLNKMNTVDDVVVSSSYSWNFSAISSNLYSDTSRIYDNHDCQLLHFVD